MRYPSVVVGLAIAAALLASACTASVDASGTLSALNNIDGVGFHAVDAALAAPGAKIDAAWLGKTRNARIAVAATTWPKELQPQATAFVTAAAALQAALEKDDVAGAAKPAHDAHEAQHDLSADAYNYLAAKSGISVPKAAGGH